ncbi:Aldehyde ferredoxin oxidoreductase [Geobacter metallireducens RCH3]|uniref:Benzoyl-CoA reductase, putative n=1 Tax=Geobacter metallireducens (strain ATCC 53774 / DSM 7210 / GS-15) TaxID=269799 RepID=Q39UP3_GEOMG|nr:MULTISPECIES: aldehyde ferredoxin oxidoreductase C-terminal domain-containing protein [Geobacter]ABB32031.1 benzoyl-CoA reductase, putative [Geobacter metallireducens GS-15]EHP88782.1 Aldehyde ferredoxin oxidoreductase [Geobacter metallireducens RCH3]MBT1074446.1 aldehyde dehydrogenase [Geobacter grbiciae]
MRYAEAGYYLEVDLAKGNIERVATDPRLMELHLGGLGTSVKLHWDRVPPETRAFDPENLLVFSTGLLNGTPVFSANRTVVSFISPQSGTLAYPMMGGFFAAELKYAGYDKIIFKNKSPDWVYLYVSNNKVELRDASHLKGRGAVETQELIRKELNDPKAQVAAIGIAGENRVFTASIEQSRSSASRLGGGAIMGDKKIKAVAVRGTGDVFLARPEEFMKELQGVTDYIKYRWANPIKDVMTILSGIGSPQEMLHTDEKWHTENFAWGNARTRRRDFWTEEIDESWSKSQHGAVKRLISCYNCPTHCGALISHKDTPRYMAKCFGKLTYAMAAYVDDLDFSWKILQRATEYGVDSFSTPQILAFAVELYEAGILTDKDFKGCPSDKEGRFFWLLDRVARREGIGDILADGVYFAARKIGNGAEAFDHNTIKKHEQLPVKLGTLDPLYFLMYSTNEKISITQMEGQWPQSAFPTMEQREEFVRDWPQIPDEKFKQIVLDWELRGEKSIPYFPTPDMCSEIVDWMEMMHNIDDAVGMCCGMSSFCLKPPYHIHNYPKIISAATGLDLDESGLKQIANRSRNLHRAYNNRLGIRRVDEKPPADHWKKRFPELEEQLLSTYYTYKGWNHDGIPTREKLEELDLGYVADDLEKRGILKNGQN